MVDGAEPQDSRIWHSLGFRVAVCAVLDLVVGAGLLATQLGFIVFMSDSVDTWPVVRTMIFGVVLGAAQAAWAGRPPALIGPLVSCLALAFAGFWALVVGPLVVMVAVGCTLGALAASWLGLQRRGGRAAGLLMAAVPVVVLTLTLVPATRLGGVDPAPLLEVIDHPGVPSVVVDTSERFESGTATGTLGDVGGCLGLVDRPGGAPDVIVVWSIGTTVDVDGTIKSPDWVDARVGDEVNLSGLVIDLPYDLEAYAPDLPRGCRMVPVLL